MRKLTRPLLGLREQTELEARTLELAACPGGRKRIDHARHLWASRKRSVFREIQRVLKAFAPDGERCMYCESNEGTDIDHFRPKARYPRLAFTWRNFLWACACCNSNSKRDQFPRDATTGRPMLIDPTRDDPSEHLEFSPSTGEIVGLTPRGEASVVVFALNRGSLVHARRLAWQTAKAQIVRYQVARHDGDVATADDARRALTTFPFADVLAALLRVAASPAAESHLDRRVRDALRDHPEIAGWL